MAPPPGFGQSSFSSAPAGFGSPVFAATAAPTAFAAAMASDAEIPGAQAIEVVATLGDSVVAAKHVSDPRGGRLSMMTVLLWVIGLGAFGLLAVSFFFFAGNASDQEVARHYWVDTLHKPLFAFRERELGLGWALSAYNTLWVAVVATFIAAWRTHGELRKPTFIVGRGHQELMLGRIIFAFLFPFWRRHLLRVRRPLPQVGVG